MAVVVLILNIQKYAIIVITALGGTSAIIFTLLAMFGNLTPAQMMLNPVMTAVSNSFWWLLFYLVLAVAGIVVQLGANRSYELESYNRFS